VTAGPDPKAGDLQRPEVTGGDVSEEFQIPFRWSANDGAAKLRVLLNETRVGEIDGVSFDLRHSDLPDANDWHSPKGAEPFGVAFPWDRDLFNGDEVAATNYVTSGGVERGWDAIHVYPGDAVTISRVRRFHRGVGGPPYEVERDCFEYWAYLRITRPDGSIVDVDESISFNARDAMGPFSPHFHISGDDGYEDYIGDFRIDYEKVSSRISKYLGAGASVHQGAWLKLATDCIDALGPPPFEEGELPRDPVDLGWMIDLAAAAGYALAKAETAPVIEKARARTKPATKARRVRTEPVRAAAEAFIAENPKTSQTACAAAVARDLGRDQRSVERAIAPMFSWKTLPGGSREKRPRTKSVWPRLTVD
jgi:hypothetical protein